MRPLIRRFIRALFPRVQASPILAEYQKWRCHFLVKRLPLTIGIAMLGILVAVLSGSIVLPTFNPVGGSRQSMNWGEPARYFYKVVAQELGLLLCLVLLKIPKVRHYPKLLFLSFSWLTALLPSILVMFQGEERLALEILLILFPTQAILVPVYWWLHLASQLGVLAYYCGSAIFGSGDSNLNQTLFHTGVVFHVFWIAFLSDLGVYWYERLRRREFVLHHQLQVFFHAVSHDLRNPVLGTVMVLKNLRHPSGENVQLPDAVLGQMISSGDRQLELINLLLETYVTEVEGISLRCQPTQLSSLIQSVVVDLQPLLNRDRAKVVHFIPTELPLVNADPLQLKRVYENLVVNALKHNRSELEITLTASQEIDQVRCTISDNGIGLSQQQCAKLFDLYTCTDNRQSLGLGLGLYLCQKIITAHSGEIGVVSKPGTGAMIWFTLPVAKALVDRHKCSK